MAFIDVGVPETVLFTERPTMTPNPVYTASPQYTFGSPNPPDIVGFDNVRNIYIDRRGHAYLVDDKGLWYDMGIASDYYATLPGTSTGPAPAGTGGNLAILALLAALFLMG